MAFVSLLYTAAIRLVFIISLWPDADLGAHLQVYTENSLQEWL